MYFCNDVFPASLRTRLRSAMKLLSSFSKISSGAGLMTRKGSSLSSSLIPIHIFQTRSWRRHIIWLMRMNLYWRKQLGKLVIFTWCCWLLVLVKSGLFNHELRFACFILLLQDWNSMASWKMLDTKGFEEKAQEGCKEC